MPLGLHHFHRRRWLWHDDGNGHAETLTVISKPLRMIARRRRNHPVFARIIAKLKQAVKRAALLERRCKLEILKLDINRRSGQFRQCLTDQRWRADNCTANPLLRRADVIKRNRKGFVGFECSRHGKAA